MICPSHNTELIGQKTQYGVRYNCTSEGCTVACWSGSTSTPADAETRKLRSECHAKFDPLWKDRINFRSRHEAYDWLSFVMSVDPEQAHIGMFDAEQCRQLLEYLAEMG